METSLEERSVGGNLLLIEDKAKPGPLGAALVKEGFRCFHARGPLKVQAILSVQPIDLILWKEDPDNRDLFPDLAQEWGRHPAIPVLHLYPPGAGPYSPPTEFCEALPCELECDAVVAAVNRLVGDLDSPALPLQNTELAFRNVVSRLRDLWGGQPGLPLPASRGQDFSSPNTGLDTRERELLMGHPARLQVPLSMVERISGAYRWVMGRMARRDRQR